MTHPEPSTLGDLWRLMQAETALTRDHVRAEIREIRQALDKYVTKERWDAERRDLERRLEVAERELAVQDERQREFQQTLQNELRASADERLTSTREFVYKGVIPALALLVAVVSLYLGSR